MPLDYLFVDLDYIFFPKICRYTGVPADKWVSADSGHGYYFVPVAGCGHGRGHRFWFAGAELPSLYLHGFYPLSSIVPQKADGRLVL